MIHPGDGTALAGAACGAAIAYPTAASLPDKSPAPADAVDVPALDLGGE